MKKRTKHTPGPWYVYKNPHATKGRFKKIDYEKHVYDSIDPLGILIDTKVIEKNAQLIASAPDMLDCLEQIVSHFKATGLSVEEHELNTFICQIIKQAKGE